MNIVTVPSDKLRIVCEDITEFDSGLHRVVASMVEKLYTSDAVGLAAPQVDIQKRIIVVDSSQGQVSHKLFIMINPKIIWTSSETAVLPEGCLSIPNVIVNVRRFTEIQVQYQNMYGHIKLNTFNGYAAQIIQHEVDHLDGILMIDKASLVDHRMTHVNLSKTAIG